ncbi:MAG TPA: hypothetical protein VN894_21155 [Polyangiaceae bacterium]|nr:hypothetical protein [Polyangiaceae bacterium]
MKIYNLRVDGDTVHHSLEMTRDEFGRFVLWKQLDGEMTYVECENWLRRNFPDYMDQLTTMTIADGDPELIGRKLWVLKPNVISFTCRFE